MNYVFAGARTQIDNWGEQLFIYSSSTRLLSFEMDYL